MLKFLLLFLVYTFFGVKESNAFWWPKHLEWIEGRAVNVTVGPEDTIYCKLQRYDITIFDGFGPCRITLDRVRSDHAGYWQMQYGTPGIVSTQYDSVSVTVVAAPVEDPLVVTPTVYRNGSSVVMTCSVPEDHEILDCTFRDPRRSLYFASREKLISIGNSYFSSAEANKCSLQLLEPATEASGIWRCAVQTTRDRAFNFTRISYSMLHPDSNLDHDDRPYLRVDGDIHGPEGGSATMHCSIDAAIRYCYYRSANGTIINMSPSMSTEDYEYIGNGFDAGDCGIRIKNLQASDHGRWSCNVGHVHSDEEHRGIIEVFVTERTTWEHRWFGSEVLVNMRISHQPELEYCRFVRNDGLGFMSDYTPSEYFSPSIDNPYGVCELRIPRPQTVDLRPWTVIIKVVGEDTERSVTTTFNPRSPPAGTTSICSIILWSSFSTLLVFVIIVSCLPKKNREWTARRAYLIRNSFRRQPHNQQTVPPTAPPPAYPTVPNQQIPPTVPNQHIPPTVPNQHIPPPPVHTDILTDLPRKVY
ncbi:hypothetical protein PYW08_008785 [Mythimna loreyi]|uniref:Uncharacterized protein n=1 Tax=Mythimna loreyi TaxID=667449 RepID=A0ACC2Q9E9_9NEOP|nr:hypothetical protein PYW08_008785 [Mythimna loreyi]